MASEERSISKLDNSKGSSRLSSESLAPKRHSGGEVQDGNKRPKLAFGLASKQGGSAASKAKPGIQIKLGSLKQAESKIVNPIGKVSAIFNNEDDDEEEEMPPEARMRMRNIGRETPTSAGPNSFGKTKHGFCDSKKVFEKDLKSKMEQPPQGEEINE